MRAALSPELIGCKRREGVRRNACLCVDAAARNRENKLRPPSPLCPVVTRRPQLRMRQLGNSSKVWIGATGLLPQTYEAKSESRCQGRLVGECRQCCFILQFGSSL